MTTEHEHEPSASGVIRHLVRCRPCRDSLATLGGGDGAVAFLEAQRDAADVTTLDRVLASTATAGRRVVADLIYELAKGCLLSDEELGRLVSWKAAPRSVSEARGALERVAQPLPELGLPIARACEMVASAEATRDDWRQVGMALVRVLEELEGRSPRQVISRAHILISDGRCDEACASLFDVVGDSSLLSSVRSLAALTLARAQLKSDKCQDLYDLVERARTEGFMIPSLALYEVASNIYEGDVSHASARLDVLRQDAVALDEAEMAHVRVITQYIADGLGYDALELSRALGGAA